MDLGFFLKLEFLNKIEFYIIKDSLIESLSLLLVFKSLGIFLEHLFVNVLI